MTTQNIPKLLFLSEDVQQLYDKRFGRKQLIYQDQNNQTVKGWQYKFNSLIKLDEDYQICQNQNESTSIFNTVYCNSIGKLFYNCKAGVCAYGMTSLGEMVKTGDFVNPVPVEEGGSLFLSPQQTKLLVINENNIHVLSLGDQLQKILTVENKYKFTNACWQNETSVYLWSFQSKLFLFDSTNGQTKQVSQINKCTGVNRINNQRTIALQGVVLHIVKQGNIVKSISLQTKNQKQPLFQYMALIGVQKLNNLSESKLQQTDLYVLIGVYYTAYDEGDDEPCHRYAFFMKGNLDNLDDLNVRGMSLVDSMHDDEEYYLGADQRTRFPFSCIISVQPNFAVVLVQKLQKVFFIDSTGDYQKMQIFSTWPKHGFKLDQDKTKNKFLKGMTIMKNMFSFEQQAAQDKISKIYCNEKFVGQFMRLFFSQKQADLTIQFPPSAICFSNSFMMRKYAACTLGACEDDNEQQILKYVQQKQKSQYIESVKRNMTVNNVREINKKIVVKQQKKEQVKYETQTGEQPIVKTDDKKIQQDNNKTDEKQSQSLVKKQEQKKQVKVQQSKQNKSEQKSKDSSGIGKQLGVPAGQNNSFLNTSFSSATKPTESQPAKPSQSQSTKPVQSQPSSQPTKPIQTKQPQAPKNLLINPTSNVFSATKPNQIVFGSATLPTFSSGVFDQSTKPIKQQDNKKLGENTKKGWFGSVDSPFVSTTNPPAQLLNDKGGLNLPMYGQGSGGFFNNSSTPKQSFFANKQQSKKSAEFNQVAAKLNAPSTLTHQSAFSTLSNPSNPLNFSNALNPLKPSSPLNPTQQKTPFTSISNPKQNPTQKQKPIQKPPTKQQKQQPPLPSITTAQKTQAKQYLQFYKKNIRQIQSKIQSYRQDTKTPQLFNLKNARKLVQNWNKISQQTNNNIFQDIGVVLKQIDAFQKIKKIKTIKGNTIQQQKDIVKKRVKQLNKKIDHLCYFATVFQKSKSNNTSIFGPAIKKQSLDPKKQEQKYIAGLLKRVKDVEKASDMLNNKYKNQLAKIKKVHDKHDKKLGRKYQFSTIQGQSQSDSQPEQTNHHFQIFQHKKKQEKNKNTITAKDIIYSLERHKQIIQFQQDQRNPIFKFVNLDEPTKSKTQSMDKKQVPKAQNPTASVFQTTKPFDQKLEGLVGSKHNQRKFIPPNLSKPENKKQSSVKASQHAESADQIQVPSTTARTISKLPIGGVKVQTANKAPPASMFPNNPAGNQFGKAGLFGEIKDQKAQPKNNMLVNAKASIFGESKDDKPKASIFGENKDDKSKPTMFGEIKDDKPKTSLPSESKKQKPLIFGVDSTTFNIKQTPKQAEKKNVATLRSTSPKSPKQQKKITVTSSQGQSKAEVKKQPEPKSGLQHYFSGFSFNELKKQKPEEIKPIIIKIDSPQVKQPQIKPTIILTQPPQQKQPQLKTQQSQQKQPQLTAPSISKKIDISSPAPQANQQKQKQQKSPAVIIKDSPKQSMNSGSSSTPTFHQTQQNTIIIPQQKKDEGTKNIGKSDQEKQRQATARGGSGISNIVSNPSTTSQETDKSANTNNANTTGNTKIGYSNLMNSSPGNFGVTQGENLFNKNNLNQQNQIPAFSQPQQQQQVNPSFSQGSSFGIYNQGHASMSFGGGNRFMNESSAPQQQPQIERFNPNQGAFTFVSSGAPKTFSSINTGNAFQNTGNTFQNQGNPFQNTGSVGQSWITPPPQMGQQQNQGFMNNHNQMQNQFNQGNNTFWQSQNQQQQSFNAAPNLPNMFGSQQTLTPPPGINPSMMQPRK